MTKDPDWVEVAAKAQAKWAELGGLGPVPNDFSWQLVVEGRADAVAEAERAVARQRHELRMRFLERAIPAALAIAHAAIDAGLTLTNDDDETEVDLFQWVANEAADTADATLDLLAREAKRG